MRKKIHLCRPPILVGAALLKFYSLNWPYHGKFRRNSCAPPRTLKLRDLYCRLIGGYILAEVNMHIDIILLGNQPAANHINEFYSNICFIIFSQFYRFYNIFPIFMLSWQYSMAASNMSFSLSGYLASISSTAGCSLPSPPHKEDMKKRNL